VSFKLGTPEARSSTWSDRCNGRLCEPGKAGGDGNDLVLFLVRGKRIPSGLQEANSKKESLIKQPERVLNTLDAAYDEFDKEYLEVN